MDLKNKTLIFKSWWSGRETGHLYALKASQHRKEAGQTKPSWDNLLQTPHGLTVCKFNVPEGKSVSMTLPAWKQHMPISSHDVMSLSDVLKGNGRCPPLCSVTSGSSLCPKHLSYSQTELLSHSSTSASLFGCFSLACLPHSHQPSDPLSKARMMPTSYSHSQIS